MNRKLKVSIAGLGNRGKDTYAKAAYKFPDKMEIVAIADKDLEKLKEVSEEYNIPKEMCFTSAEQMIEHEKLADVMIIATQDRQHVKQAIPALKKGYDLLIEKPISPILEECNEILNVAKQYKRKVVVCHVLRYTPFFIKLKEIIDSGIIGEVVTLMAIENVRWWHQAHGFVRGNWRNSDTTSPMILQKCCHDFDMYLWLTGKKCKEVSSFGGNFLFRKECAPKGSADRCLNGCKVKEECPYDAEKIYITSKKTGIAKGVPDWPNNVLCLNPTEETLREALKTGPYGRCVYHCDNNVVDHQVVNMNMTDGSTMHLTMTAFNATGTRVAKIMGTKGEIIADLKANNIKVTPFGEETKEIDVSQLANDFSGHAGGDYKMVEEFLDLISNNKEILGNITSIENSLESHYCALAAEESRKNSGTVINLDKFRLKS